MHAQHPLPRPNPPAAQLTPLSSPAPCCARHARRCQIARRGASPAALSRFCCSCLRRRLRAWPQLPDSRARPVLVSIGVALVPVAHTLAVCRSHKGNARTRTHTCTQLRWPRNGSGGVLASQELRMQQGRAGQGVEKQLSCVNNSGLCTGAPPRINVQRSGSLPRGGRRHAACAPTSVPHHPALISRAATPSSGAFRAIACSSAGQMHTGIITHHPLMCNHTCMQCSWRACACGNG